MSEKPEILVRPAVLAGDYPLVCNIRNYRTQRAMTIGELGRKTQLTSQAITELEGGLASPKLTTAFKLADALGVEVADLYVRNGQWEAPKQVTPPPPAPPKKRTVFGVSVPRVLAK